MKYLLLLFGWLISLHCCGQATDRVVRDLKTGRLRDDTSFVYHLPYTKGRRFLFIQGANSRMSHTNELSYDFKMAKGNNICAARDGVVIETKADSDQGGLKEELLHNGNHIIVLHADGSKAKYWHLQHNGVLVNTGDFIHPGQVIGLSGNTGYTAFPHLHFQVISPQGKEILVRFRTKKGRLYLRPGKRYKSVG
jgi:murein DD-endopeptidase MepM/ murein hydrolase activator NlpD